MGGRIDHDVIGLNSGSLQTVEQGLTKVISPYLTDQMDRNSQLSYGYGLISPLATGSSEKLVTNYGFSPRWQVGNLNDQIYINTSKDDNYHKQLITEFGDYPTILKKKLPIGRFDSVTAKMLL